MGSSTLKRIDVISDPQARVGMVRSLHLDEHLDSADIEPEQGELNALLASNDIVGDGPDVYDATRSLDWATREALIASSIAFVDYVTPELVAAENDSRIVRSDRLGEHVKTKVVSQIAQTGADIGAAPSPQSIAFRRRRSVGVTAIHGSGFLSLFHAEVTRDGPFWSIGVPEIGESITTAERSEIADKAHELISSHTGLRDDDIRVVVCSERDSVRARARKLGFEISGDEGSREDLYLLRTRSVAVRYDNYGVVVNVDASRRFRAGCLDVVAAPGRFARFVAAHQIGPLVAGLMRGFDSL